MNPFKYPQCQPILGLDMCVIHPAIISEAPQPQTDFGLKPNGLTLDDLQSNKEFLSHGDDLDKAAIAAKTSSSMSKETRQTISQLQKLAKSVTPKRN